MQHDAALSYADVHVHRERRGVDEFQQTSSQPFKDRADMVGFQLHHCSRTGMKASDVDLRPDDCVRDLGVLIDSGMRLARHVNYISGVRFFQL